MEKELVPVKNILANIFEKIIEMKENVIALPPREKRLPDQSIERLRLAVAYGWNEKEKRGPWKSGDHGFEDGDLLDVFYAPTGKLSEPEMIAIINEASRGASRAALAEHIAILAAHKKYTGSDGFTFVMSDILRFISHFSELAIRNAMDYLKMRDDSPWFPPAREIIRQVEWEQKKIDNLADSIKKTSIF